MPQTKRKADSVLRQVLQTGGLKLSVSAARRVIDVCREHLADEAADGGAGGVRLSRAGLRDMVVPLYGRVVKELVVPDWNDKPLKLQVVDPVALLLWLASRSPRFAHFLRTNIGNTTSQLVLWIDDTTPGVGTDQ
jgi:hypothetical protein